MAYDFSCVYMISRLVMQAKLLVSTWVLNMLLSQFIFPCTYIPDSGKLSGEPANIGVVVPSAAVQKEN